MGAITGHCFNPCFRGTRSRTRAFFPAPPEFYLSFNPCFRGTRSRTSEASLDIPRPSVSILVFVELALGPEFMQPDSITTRQFQSLFSWNSLSDTGNHFANAYIGMFQSLFSWNSLSDTEPISESFVFSPCFNPCFRGTRSRTDAREVLPVQEISMFQSLFSWNSLSDFFPRFPPACRRCFNPCFRGTRSRTSILGTEAVPVLTFQSLFSWNSLSDAGCSGSRCLRTACFNPCFRGTRSRTPQSDRGYPGRQRFNPCFRGTRSRTKISSPICKTNQGFNPCFRGTRSRT